MENRTRLISLDGNPATVVSPKKFRSGKEGYYSQQSTVIDGKNATIQVLIYYTPEETK